MGREGFALHSGNNLYIHPIGPKTQIFKTYLSLRAVHKQRWRFGSVLAQEGTPSLLWIDALTGRRITVGHSVAKRRHAQAGQELPALILAGQVQGFYPELGYIFWIIRSCIIKVGLFSALVVHFSDGAGC